MAETTKPEPKKPEPKKPQTEKSAKYTDEEIQNLAWNIEKGRHPIMNEHNEVDEQLYNEVWKPNWAKLKEMLPLAKKVMKDKEKKLHVDLLLEYTPKKK